MIFGLPVSELSAAILVFFTTLLPAHGIYKKVNVFDEFVKGGKAGIEVIIKIAPFIVGMVTAIGMLRASGFFTNMNDIIGSILIQYGVDSDLISLALIRPFSGAASNANLASIVSEHGPDSMIARIAATVMGSTETVFYIIPVYFGAVAINQVRFTIWVSLLADLAGFIAAIYFCHLLL